jgi:nucleotidyltransferase substrate binding protein (TIGR01987 family)
MKLDFNPLKRSIEALGRAIEVERRWESEDDLQETIRAGIIQSFEVAYEQCWKGIQRWLKENVNMWEFRTRKDLFRQAAQYGLVDDPSRWFQYGEARNQTSHTYNDEQSRLVHEKAVSFYEDARRLFQQLECSND